MTVNQPFLTVYNLVKNQKKRFMGREIISLPTHFMIPYSIELYVISAVAGCGWLIFFRVVLNYSNYLELYNNPTHSASATP